jgi:hypothetical protein
MLNQHNAGYRQLLQRIKVVGAVGVTLLPFLAGNITAEPFTRGGLPPGVAADEPSLTLISPLEGLTLETYGPAEPYDLLTRLRFGFTLDYEDNNRIAAERNWFVRHPDYLSRVFTRAQRYLPYITAEIERRGSASSRTGGTTAAATSSIRRVPRSTTWNTSMNSTMATGSTRSPRTTPAKATCSGP